MWGHFNAEPNQLLHAFQQLDPWQRAVAAHVGDGALYGQTIQEVAQLDLRGIVLDYQERAHRFQT